MNVYQCVCPCAYGHVVLNVSGKSAIASVIPLSLEHSFLAPGLLSLLIRFPGYTRCLGTSHTFYP